MKKGTKSLLFGVHQFIWHPFTVWRAWRILYGSNPSWRECVCIVIHDWGYIGCENMDDEKGELHPYWAANVAGRLFGPAFYDLVLLHSRHLAKKLGRPPSKLCWADKASMAFDPSWFYIPRALATGELQEYRRNAARVGFVGAEYPHEFWHRKIVRHHFEMSLDKAKEFTAANAQA